MDEQERLEVKLDILGELIDIFESADELWEVRESLAVSYSRARDRIEAIEENEINQEGLGGHDNL